MGLTSHLSSNPRPLKFHFSTRHLRSPVTMQLTNLIVLLAAVPTLGQNLGSGAASGASSVLSSAISGAGSATSTDSAVSSSASSAGASAASSASSSIASITSAASNSAAAASASAQSVQESVANSFSSAESAFSTNRFDWSCWCCAVGSCCSVVRGGWLGSQYQFVQQKTLSFYFLPNTHGIRVLVHSKVMGNSVAIKSKH